MGWAGVLSMAIFHLCLWANKSVSFYKLMGCGKNGTFDKIPDLNQWALLLVKPSALATDKNVFPSLILFWWKIFRCEKWTLELHPIEGHGTWDGKHCFGILPKQTDYDGVIAVLTRATIRTSKLMDFWKNVDSVAHQMAGTDGFITSVGIGEIPWIKQATFSIWQNKSSMKTFAYQMKEHAAVIRKTNQEKWYSEDMFVRFKIVASHGTLNRIEPLQGKL
jgi:hypothetical protein